LGISSEPIVPTDTPQGVTAINLKGTTPSAKDATPQVLEVMQEADL